MGFINDETKKQELIKELKTIKKKCPYEQLSFMLECLVDFIRHIILKFLQFITNDKTMATQLHESKNDIKVATEDGTVFKNLPYEAAERRVLYFDDDTKESISLAFNKKVEVFLVDLKEAVFKISKKSLVNVIVESIEPGTSCCVT
ncbi:hypothetical protein [Candidatus Mesenet endosymbiont of Agriotes lineatus]|uniref:hypothetical protein n=1 Tax=Candidatus Mesenet endosymbiont of Agriotes lineatus TaxID=3077948 RepID=UPI0030D3FAA6